MQGSLKFFLFCLPLWICLEVEAKRCQYAILDQQKIELETINSEVRFDYTKAVSPRRCQNMFRKVQIFNEDIKLVTFCSANNCTGLLDFPCIRSNSLVVKFMFKQEIKMMKISLDFECPLSNKYQVVYWIVGIVSSLSIMLLIALSFFCWYRKKSKENTSGNLLYNENFKPEEIESESKFWVNWTN